VHEPAEPLRVTGQGDAPLARSTPSTVSSRITQAAGGVDCGQGDGQPMCRGDRGVGDGAIWMSVIGSRTRATWPMCSRRIGSAKISRRRLAKRNSDCNATNVQYRPQRGPQIADDRAPPRSFGARVVDHPEPPGAPSGPPTSWPRVRA
jgi:hypothetical protein